MFRVRIQLPKRQSQQYRYYDILHDALINAWIAAGAKSHEVIGVSALLWNFAALGQHEKQQGNVHTLIVATPDKTLAAYLARFEVKHIRYIRALTEEFVDFSAAKIYQEVDPIVTNQKNLGVVLLSPLAIQKRGCKPRQWHEKLQEVDVSSAVNYRLSRLAQRKVELTIYPDSLHLRINPKHGVSVKTKRMKGKKEVFVIGMQAPLLLIGSDDDLRMAWYAGIGEKNRNGFGCIGLADKGIGR
jgi:CRISPR-associated endoribonuclease Cas6